MIRMVGKAGLRRSLGRTVPCTVVCSREARTLPPCREDCRVLGLTARRTASLQVWGHGDLHQLGQAFGTEPLHDVGPMDLHRARTDLEILGKRSVGSSGEWTISLAR
jgi:hypothetical protein